MPNHLKTFPECQHYEDTIFSKKGSMISKVIQGHFYAKIILAHSFLDRFDENLYEW